MNSKFLILGFAIAIIFTISLTQNIQISDGFSAVSNTVNFELELGDTKIDTWKVINDSDEKIWVEFYARGSGSEFLTFEKVISFEPRQNKSVEIIVSIPVDHPNDIEYRPTLVALMRGEPVPDGVNGAQVNIELRKIISIKIGDDPVYTLPVEEEPKITPPAIVIAEKEAEKAAKEAVETIEEKLERIRLANEKLIEKTLEQIDDTSLPKVTQEDNGYISEPVTPLTYDEPAASEDGGGCLIATATFGSELAPQVQFLREIRDNTLLSTTTGVSFMTGFNQLYYSFSPYIADMERQNPIFKEMMKVTLTPMLFTLSIITLADEGSESQVLGLGISVIALNLGMYLVAPAIVINKIHSYRKSK